MGFFCEAALCWADDAKRKTTQKYPWMKELSWVKFPSIRQQCTRTAWRNLVRTCIWICSAAEPARAVVTVPEVSVPAKIPRMLISIVDIAEYRLNAIRRIADDDSELEQRAADADIPGRT